MPSGIVFDIKELALFNGPGININVFLKGCPMSCVWCHNPEGIAPTIAEIKKSDRIKEVGKLYSADDLARVLSGYSDLIKFTDGKIVFTGGEPLFQHEFLLEVIQLLPELNFAVETSGCIDSNVIYAVSEKVNLYYYDLKIMNDELHRKHTGQSNEQILKNLKILSQLNKEIVIRVPLIPGITDTAKNLIEIIDYIKKLSSVRLIQLLYYNPYTAAKYEFYNMKFNYTEIEVKEVDLGIFNSIGIPVQIRRI